MQNQTPGSTALLTKAQILQKIWTYFTTKQHRLGRSPTDQCLYRYETETGEVLRCAIGCLAPDHLSRHWDTYTKELSYDYLVKRLRRLGENLLEIGIDIESEDTTIFLTNIQQLHDRAASHAAFLDRLQAFAKTHGVFLGSPPSLDS